MYCIYKTPVKKLNFAKNVLGKMVLFNHCFTKLVKYW